MENRFYVGTDLKPPRAASRARPSPAEVKPSLAQSLGLGRSLTGYARSFSADQRALVVLIENGGVDLGIPDLADKLIGALPNIVQIPETVRQQLIVFLRDKIKAATDNLLESAEL